MIIVGFLSALMAQQKETIVDFSSKQQPDTTYTKPKISNTPATQLTVEETNSTIEEANYSISQSSLDSLKRELTLLKKEIGINKNTLTNMQGNLFKAHKKFKLGMYLLIAGSVASSLSSAIIANAQQSGLQPPQEAILLGIGAFGATITGIVFIFNANKYIGRAGKGRGERYESYRPATNYY